MNWKNAEMNGALKEEKMNGNVGMQDDDSEQLLVTIVSARYAPCEGSLGINNRAAVGAYTRDVTPFLRALLVAQKLRESRNTSADFSADHDCYEQQAVRLNALVAGQRRAQIRVLDGDDRTTGGRGMNTIFGDPIPGTSKRLYVEYRIQATDEHGNKAVESHSISFAEHERIVLPVLARRRSRLTVYQDRINDELRTAAITKAPTVNGKAQETISRDQWKLQSSTSELVLPLIMPFLNFKERVQCRLICSVWRNIVREWGVATTIDDNDPSFANCFSPTFLRGILSHSYSSLQCLFLSGTPNLQQDDLHPAITHLRKLRSLDISRCVNLDDLTLQLLAKHVSDTLQVLYIKGLCRVTDDGLIAIARSCHSLKVLEISNLAITDRAAMEIGEHLTSLRAIYMRDNYLLTNKSIDVITKRCTALEQLTLWGCIRMRHLSFDDNKLESSSVFTSGNLILLSLWGCHSLNDGAAQALQGMTQLRSLIVSECHRLSDEYVISIAEHVPQLQHLHLRYCRKISDKGVNLITQTMQDLYSLDLSFCSKVSIAAIFNLLEIRGDSLAELRLQGCRNLDIARDPNDPLPPSPQRGRQQQYNGGYAGRQILSVLRSSALLNSTSSCLSVLDVRQCTGQLSLDVGYPDEDPFVEGMTFLQFQQTVPGFFSRPARRNLNVESRLVKQFLAASNRSSTHVQPSL